MEQGAEDDQFIEQRVDCQRDLYTGGLRISGLSNGRENVYEV